MRSRHWRTGRRPVALLALALLGTACVDHRANALRFCEEVAPMVDEHRSGEKLSAEQSEDRADSIAGVMRYAEDGTRTVREAGRAALAAYDDYAEAADKDRPPPDVESKRQEIATTQAVLRGACEETGSARD